VSEYLIEVRGLTKRFGGLVVTDDVDLGIRRHETHALIGPNGAGKTTFIGQLSGALAPDCGRVLFDGREVTGLAAHERARLGFARSFQITSVFHHFTVRDNVALAVQARSGSSFRFWNPVAEEKSLYAAATEILQQVGLEARADWMAGMLSHGEHRQLELALALATRPQLLLLDEPTAGMGPEESARMVALVERLKPVYTILLVEHDMDAVFRLADRISVMLSGRVIATGSVEEIRANQQVRTAYLGDEEARA
jgi:branched-chain amino acid transport system ATP-binding protein